MPRVGGEFVAPYPDVESGHTIESIVHNGTVADFVADANDARPITAGGTGAVSAAAARTNLQIEVRGVQVTNYDSHVWEAGSFFSLSGATGAPAAEAFMGICIILGSNSDYMTLQARGTVTGRLYYRLKNITWGAWTVDGAADYVNVTGDTMTGTLTVPTLAFNSNNLITADASMVLRTNGDVYVTNIAGSAFQKIFLGEPTNLSHAATKNYVDTRVLKTGDTMSGYLTMPTISPTDPGHEFYAANRTYVNTYVNDYFATGGTMTSLTITGGYITVDALPGGNAHLWLRDEASATKGYFYWERSTNTLIIQTGAGTQYLFNDGSAYKAGGGAWTASSDARIKTVHGDYESGLAEILTLQPVRYSYNGNDSFAPSAVSQHDVVAKSAKEFIGLVAQDVEGVMPELVTQSEGYIDGQHVTDLRSLDSTPLIFALINSVKELTARIEALEGVSAARSG